MFKYLWLNIEESVIGWIYVSTEFLSPAGAVGPGTGDIATPPRPSVRLSCLSVTFSFCNVNALLYFLETLQVRAPSGGGVLYSF